MYGWLPAVCDDAAQVVTASHRLARVLTAEYNARQQASGKLAWLTPVIVAWPDWLARLFGSAVPGRQPTRINSHQSRVLWESTLREVIDDPLVNIASLSRHAREAWKRMHEWQVPFDECVSAASSRDQHVFAAAASRYRERLSAEDWIDDVMLGSKLTAAIREGEVATPEKLVLAGFDRLTPEVDALLAALRERGTRIDLATAEDAKPRACVVACKEPDAELRAAGAWARTQLREDPSRRIGIVVSNLDQDAARAGRLVREGLVPGWQHAAGSQRAAVNVSFGRRLNDYPAIAIALLLLRWTHNAISGRDLSLLLRTPFLGVGEVDARARLELELRRIPDRDWTPGLLLRAFGSRKSANNATDWLLRLGALVELGRSQQREASPAHWAQVVDSLLENFGWPGETGLESGDFQLVNRWRDLLNDLARLELVMPLISFGRAIGQLSAMASDTVFQPQMEGAVVQVLGPLEAAGLEFDQLWIAGLTASQWPPPGRPTALISRRLQRHYGMPDADPDDTAAYAQRVIDRLLGSAASCICSYPSSSGDSIETPTTLLADTPAGSAPQDPGWYAAQLFGLAASIELASDPVPPVTPAESVAGGAATLQRQMTEPFTAFATGRLGISTLRQIVPGLSQIVRGNLIHAAAFHLYEERPSQAEIRAWSSGELDDRIEKAVHYAFVRHERHADRVLRELLRLERERVARLLHELVAVDLQRECFDVHAVELSMDFVLAGVRLGLRVDRIDRYDDGAVAILDYKTGSPRKFLDRNGDPTDAQLTIYATAVEAPVADLGFYNIDSRETALSRSGRDVMGAEEWQQSLQRWIEAVENAAAEFAAGDVRIRHWQTRREARPLNILSRFGELRRDA
jgi:probable DNA repair protein